MSLFALYRESLSDAARRRITPVIGVICLVSIFMIDGCTACASGEVFVNGEPRSIAEVAGGAGMASMLVLGLWVLVLAGLLAADHLRQTLEDGSAALCLARPVSRTSFVWARLLGVLTLAGLAGALLLGTTAVLLARRSGLPLAPALLSALACAGGALVVAALSMAASLYLPRLGTALLTLASVGAVAMANVVGAFREPGGGWLSVLDRVGPPLAIAIAKPLAAWIPGIEIASDASMLTLRLAVWCALAVGVLQWSFGRVELGR